jgi:hypothetical protein
MDGSAVWSREADVDLRDGSTAYVRAEEVEAVADTGRPVRAPKAVVRRSIQELTPDRRADGRWLQGVGGDHECADA